MYSVSKTLALAIGLVIMLSSVTTAQVMIPASCTMKPHNCYTYTRTSPRTTCPKVTPPPGAVCPQVVSVSTYTVPCATDCCPTTATATIQGPCPPSVRCPVPTAYETTTTGACVRGRATMGLQ